MAKRQYVWWAMGLVVLAAFVGIGGIHWQREQAASKYVDSRTTTFFFHGWGSSSHAEEHMANAAKKAEASNKIIKVNVAKGGKTTIKGNISKDSRNPIVEVNFADNKNDNYRQDGQYAKDAIVAVQKKFGIKDINLVGHSMGNLAIVYYLLNNANDTSLPTVRHHVAIAGHFDGGIGFGYNDKTKLDQNGQPNIMEEHYQQLLGLRNTYPQTAKVLNIAGDLGDGTHSDEEVPVNSAFSLKYLLGGREKSYRQVVIHGKQAQHSKLHSNSQVDRLLINFLWSKKEN